MGDLPAACKHVFGRVFCVSCGASRDEALGIANARLAELEARAEQAEDNLAGLEHALVRANERYTQAEARYKDEHANRISEGLNLSLELDFSTLARMEAEAELAAQKKYADDW